MAQPHCKGCGRQLLREETGDGLCTQRPPRWDKAVQGRVPDANPGCAIAFLGWLTPKVAAQVNGTQLNDPRRLVAIDRWLETR